MKGVSNRFKNMASKTESGIVLLYFLLYLTAALALILKQPFGNPPDEYNRYLIPQYIAAHGTLPNGYDEAVRIGGYGFSYAFQPILPYIIQGFCMRLAAAFHASDHTLLLTARCVNLVFGLIMAAFVLLLSAEWFSEKRLRYLFSFLVTFLPQSLFVHTYVNTDSCCMMSIAMILYGLTLGIRHGFPRKSCVILSVGIIFCALSYYNAYGFILSSILLFAFYFVKGGEDRRLVIDWAGMLQKGAFISAVVLLGIGWWFIRSGILYDGDILGLRARNQCASLYALPEFHPQTQMTWERQGKTVFDMLAHSSFLNLSILSFIGVYGPMTIVTALWIYRFYKALFLTGILSAVFLPASLLREKRETGTYRPLYTAFYHANMIFCILTPVFLSVFYSYHTDYQPQGRYLLPMLIPFCRYCVRGLEKLSGLIAARIKKPAGKTVFNRLLTGLCLILLLLIVLSVLVTIFGYAYPYYEANPVAP